MSSPEKNDKKKTKAPDGKPAAKKPVPVAPMFRGGEAGPDGSIV